MATTATPEGRFLATNQIVDDLLELIRQDTPEAEDLRQLLKIQSNCDFPQQLATQLNDRNSELQRFIRENFHPNQGVSTLGAASRLYFNAASVAKGNSGNVIVRNESDPNVMLHLAQQGQLNDHMHVKDPGFLISNNRVYFTRTGSYLLNLHLRLGMWSGLGALQDAQAPAWRFSDTVVNRSLSLQPFLRLYGSLTGGVAYVDVKLLPLLLTKQMVEAKEPISLCARTTFKALTGSDVFGRIESFEVGLERGNTIAYFSNRPDAIGTFKTTDAGVVDTSNFIDLVEI